MKLLIIIVLALAAATTIGLVSLDNPGLMVVSYGADSWELPLALALLFIAVAFAVLYLAFNFLFSVFRAPKKARAWNEQRQNRNAQNDTLRGYARLIEGDWVQGEKDLVKRLGHCNTPMLNYLGAAYAAQQQQNFAKRDEYLTQAEGIDPTNRMAIDISRARMLTQAGQFDEAGKLLADMHMHAPANKTILRLKADVCKRTEDWQGLKTLLPGLKKTNALPKEQVLALELAVAEAGLRQALPDAQNPATLAQYKRLPGKHKKEAAMALIYARKLIEEGELTAAEAVVRKAIKKKWNSDLAGLYGLTRVENLRGQIALAATWLSEHEQDTNVNLTLARLNYAYGQIDKARVYYNMAIELGAGNEAYFELGQFYEEEGNHKSALSYYKRGIQASIDQTQPLVSAPAVTKSLESVVTPGAADKGVSPVSTNDSTGQGSSRIRPQPSSRDGNEIEEAQLIEHKGPA
jgi:HemY protein